MIPVPKLDGLDSAFGNINHLPKYEDIPEEFKRERNEYVKVQRTWFFKGLDKDVLIPREGINEKDALRALAAIQRSWDPSHEHKQAGVAYLMSQWFTINPSFGEEDA